MQYAGIISVCSEIPMKPVSKLCGQNVELLNVKRLQRNQWALKYYNKMERMPKEVLCP